MSSLTGIVRNRAWPSTGSWSCVIARILNPVNSPPGTINLRLGAVRRLAYEAADCGLLSADLAASTCTGVKPSAFLAAVGRCIRSGMRTETLAERRFRIGIPYRVGGKAGESTESTNGLGVKSAREVLRGVRVTSCPR